MDWIVLLIAIVVVAATWLAVDRIARALRRPDRHKSFDWIEALLVAGMIALAIRTFLVEPFRIPSGSMIPTLLVGDYIFVNKHSYGLRVPFTDTWLLDDHQPQRGEVIVFRYPREPDKDFIKRIVGLPGDTVEYRNKRVYVNGQEVGANPSGHFRYLDHYGRPIDTASFQEALPEAAPHTLILNPKAFADDRGPFHVPPEHFFVMGDNRDDSNDSRYWGFVPKANLIGRAEMVGWSWDHLDGGLRTDRFFVPIK